MGGNPAYDAPADLDLPALIKSVPEVVRYSYYVDETSQLADTQIAACGPERISEISLIASASTTSRSDRADRTSPGRTTTAWLP